MSAGASDHGRIRETTPRTYYESVVRVPGMGEAPNRCRDLTPVGVCEAGHPVLGRSSCETRGCPDHWRDWLEGAVVSMVARLAAYRHAVEGAEKRLSHVVASPPQDRRYTTEQMWEARSDAYEAAEAAGVRGGVCVTHAYRTNERGNHLYETAREDGDVEEGTGRWAFLRETADDWDEMSRYIEAAPHYHMLAAGPSIEGEEAPGDWVVKNIRSVGRFHLRDIEAYREMVAPAYYVLTHGAVEQGRHTSSYWGDVHPAAFDPEEALTATAWTKIQNMAEAAVETEPGESHMDAGSSGEPDECPRSECEAVVREVAHVRDLLEDDEWVSEVLARRDGRRRLHRLMGVQVWLLDGGDRPPPGARTSRPRLLEWLEERGRLHTPAPEQQSLRAAGALPSV